MLTRNTLLQGREHSTLIVEAVESAEPDVAVSLVLAGLNEAAIVEKNLATLCEYMETLDPPLTWEIVFVNDGSTDKTGDIVEAFARTRSNIRVLHNERNRGLGHALRLAFEHCRGEYVVCLDVDLSFGPDHIPKLIAKIRETKAKIVATSPYMKGGQITKVPWLRKIMTIWSNRFLSFVAKGKLSSMTPMVRAYDRRFLESLDLRSNGMDINIEILFKAMILNAPIAELPSHMDWSLQREEGLGRQSKMKIFQHTLAVLFSGFLFRPVLFFVLPGLVFLLMSIYTNFWMFVRVVEEYRRMDAAGGGIHQFDAAVAAAFSAAPHTFIVGGLTLVIAIQLIGLGILALQSTRYFEEMFHLGSSILKGQRRAAKNHGQQ